MKEQIQKPKTKSITTNGIGYSPLTERVYLGKQNQSKRMWIGDKKDITNDFLAVAHEYFEENTIRKISSAKSENLFINIKNDKQTIERLIKKLQTNYLKKIEP